MPHPEGRNKIPEALPPPRLKHTANSDGRKGEELGEKRVNFMFELEKRETDKLIIYL